MYFLSFFDILVHTYMNLDKICMRIKVQMQLHKALDYLLT